MFETRWLLGPSTQSLEAEHRQRDYQECWQGLRRHFDPIQP
jgi:homogentisate 1,2-dioxygenase